MPIDYKKTEKDLYQPKPTPSIIDVPEMTFIAIDGKGDPNISDDYKAALEVLYGLSYSIKMSKVGSNASAGYFEYIVPPLEGFWNTDDVFFQGGGASIPDKGKFKWTSVIRQPEFVTIEVFDMAKTALAKKKPGIKTDKARLMKYTEGLCVQVMHIGSYDDEPAIIAAMDKFATDNGYAIDINEIRRHHEIYLSDPRKTAPEKLKTVIRHPIKMIEDDA